MLYTLAYPTLTASDRAFIDRLRGEHDPLYRDVVAPHFTLVFGSAAVAEEEYLRHGAAVAGETQAVPFCCRYAMPGADPQSETAYVYLVPDEGYAGLSLLHDRLYRGVLEQQLRLDIPYVPHITVATLSERHAAKRLCDELNEQGLQIAGSVEAITVAALQGGKIVDLAAFPLAPRVAGLR